MLQAVRFRLAYSTCVCAELCQPASVPQCPSPRVALEVAVCCLMPQSLSADSAGWAHRQSSSPMDHSSPPTGRRWISDPPFRFLQNVVVCTFILFFYSKKKGPFQRIPKLTDPCVNLLTSAGVCQSRVWNTCVFHLPCLVMQLSAGGLQRGHCPEVWVLSCSPLLWVG